MCKRRSWGVLVVGESEGEFDCLQKAGWGGAALPGDVKCSAVVG